MIRTLKRTALFTALALFSMGMLVNCSDDNPKSQKKGSVVNDIVDSLAVTVAETVVTPMLTRKAVAVEPVEETRNDNLIQHVSDILVIEPIMYATFDGGLIVYNFETKEQNVYTVDDNLKAVELFEGTVWVGGDYLYQFVDNDLVKLDDEFAGGIVDLVDHDYRLLIGTETGLYAHGIFGKEALYEDVEISALVADDNGVWVGTHGQGLYRWDGEEFKKRYLLRDEALFDTVQSLAFSREHLYMGTTNGFHIYDGGRWTTVTVEDGLPEGKIKAIDASGWVVYLATENGVTSWFNDEFIPVEKLAETTSDALTRREGRLIVGTDYEGVLIRSGRVVRTLVDPVIDINIDVLSLIQ